jgi:hypothetical protein
LASFLAHWMEAALKARAQNSIELDNILEKLFQTCAFNAEQWPLICKSCNENHPFYTVLNQFPQCKVFSYSQCRFWMDFGIGHTKR